MAVLPILALYCLELCPQDWRLYIVQEYCDGGTLRRALDLKAFNDPTTHTPRLVSSLERVCPLPWDPGIRLAATRGANSSV